MLDAVAFFGDAPGGDFVSQEIAVHLLGVGMEEATSARRLSGEPPVTWRSSSC